MQENYNYDTQNYTGCGERILKLSEYYRFPPCKGIKPHT
jgi:hypothetical protein